MRRFVIVLFLAVLVLALARGTQSGIEFRGSLSANETELQEGYFAVAQDTVLMVRPGSQQHAWLKAHAGQTVRILVEPATTP
jgi:hypothetical protein